MGNTPKRMNQIRLILQLHAKGHKVRAITRQLGMSRNTVRDYLRRCLDFEPNAQVLLALSEEELSAIAYGQPPGPGRGDRQADFEKRAPDLVLELGKVGVTRLLLWEEYRQVNPKGYGYTQFCEHLKAYLSKQQAVMHLDHKAGERLMIDFAGKLLSYVDPQSGEVITCPVFVAVLPFSGYSYVEVVASQRQEDFVGAIANALAFFGAVAPCILIDNLKSGVKRANRYEPVFTQLLEQLSLHYECTFMATRVAHPRDKPHVEREVQLVYQRIYAPLRHQQFTSLDELNAAVRLKLTKHHQTPFQRKAGGNRQTLFEEHERPALRPLPPTPFVVKYTIQAKVQPNYHIVLGQDWHYYSVPHQYIGKKVQVVYTARQVEVYFQHQRIALHARSRLPYAYTTLAGHMPPAHQHYREQKGWTGEYFREQAHQVGPQCLAVIEQILTTKMFIEQTYNSCLGVLRLGTKFGSARLEAACTRALRGHRINYTIIRNILKNNLDQLETPAPTPCPIPEHDNIRGPQAYL